MTASVVLYTERRQRRGTGSEPGPTSAGEAPVEAGSIHATDPTGPPDVDDRRRNPRIPARGLFLFNNLSGGGDDGAIADLAPDHRGSPLAAVATRNPDGLDPRTRSARSPCSPVAIRSRSACPVADRADNRPHDWPDDGHHDRPDDRSHDWSHDRSHDGRLHPRRAGTPASSLGGKTVVLLDTFKQGTRSPVRGGRHGLQRGRSVTRSAAGRSSCSRSTGDCATFLFGDEPFTLCANVHQVAGSRAVPAVRPRGERSPVAGAAKAAPRCTPAWAREPIPMMCACCGC